MAIEEFRRVRYSRFYNFEGFEADEHPKHIRPRQLRKAASWLLDHGFLPLRGAYEYGSERDRTDEGFSVSRLEKDLDEKHFRYPERPLPDMMLGPYFIKDSDGSFHIRVGEAAISRWARSTEITDADVDPESDIEAAA